MIAEIKKYDALNWCKYSVWVFIGIAIFWSIQLLIILFAPSPIRGYVGDVSPLPTPPTQIVKPDFYYELVSAVKATVIVVLPPAFLAVITRHILVKPLKEGKMPSKALHTILIVLGFLWGLIIGGIVLLITYGKIREISN